MVTDVLILSTRYTHSTQHHTTLKFT